MVRSDAAGRVDVMVIAAHPDDDIIMAGGVTRAALDSDKSVMVAYLTNGDEYDATIGTTRQNEGVAAQAVLGLGESNLVFFGYPSTYLNCIRYGNIYPHCEDDTWIATLPFTVTYASRGLNSTDYHYSWTGSHADFTWDNASSDLYRLLEENRPADIYTHAVWDIHPDHSVVAYAVMEAVDAIPGYDPVIHINIVHPEDPDYPFAWPDYSGGLPQATPNYSATLAITPTNEWDLLESTTGGELVWDQREVVPVPADMLNSYSGNNTKFLAVAAHDSQFYDTGGLIQRFIHTDEIFWKYRVGAPAGVGDAYTVDEGGSLTIAGGQGVLANDIRGTSGIVPQIAWDMLGPMSAQKVTGPAHGTVMLNTDGSFTYTHDGSETTHDWFSYYIAQGTETSSAVTVDINVNPVDENPTADNDGPYGVANGESISVSAPGVLEGDSDPEGPSLSAQLVSDVSQGTLTLGGDGSFTYTHDGSATLADSFTYVAKDPAGNASNQATVAITIQPAGYVPPLDVTVTGPTTGATGMLQTFTSGVSGGEGTRRYAWAARRSGDVVATSAATSFSFTPDAPGTYDVELIVSDAVGSGGDIAKMAVLGDLGSSAFLSDIIWLADAGITRGCNPPTNDRFCPNDYVTRGQMAAFLVRFLGLTDIGGGDLFLDDDGLVFESDIDKLAVGGITLGCNPPANDRFCPNDYVTRGQMAAFLVRALGLTDDGGGDLFLDDDGLVFESHIDQLATAGVTRGCNPPDNTLFCPNSLVTRGQMAAFLHRAEGL
jgi:LmbE family N-acetylglucosaminyl deacetylase